MRIGELSSVTHCPVTKIRYYEEKGLMPPAKRSLNGQRIYGKADAERLRFITSCRSNNMPLDCIAWFLAFESKEAPNCEELRAKIAFYLEKVAQQREDLDRLEAHLRSLLDRFVLPDETPLTTEPERYEAGLKSKGRFLEEPKS